MQRFDPYEYEEDINELLLEAAGIGDLEKVKSLLKQGADVNYTDSINYTPLTRAVENNHIEVVARLLKEKNIDTSITVLESQDALGEATALHIAAFRGFDEIVKMLIDGSRENIDDLEYCGYTPLHETILSRQFSTFKLLLNLGASYIETTEETSVTETPGGLNALGLIMYELTNGFKSHSDNNSFELIRMLVYLLKKHKTELPRKKHFGEKKENLDFYYLVADNLNNPAVLYKKLLAFFKIPEAQLKQESLNGIFGDYQDLSDDDSEDEMDYQYEDKLELHRKTVEEKIKENFSEKTSPVLIPHFRGVHFYPQYFNYEGRKLERALADKQARGEIVREPLFCDATHELAKVSYQLPVVDSVLELGPLLRERTQQLTTQSEKVTAAVQLMQSQKKVEPCLIHTKREHYETRYYEFVQRYVNSYAALKKEMEKADKVDLSTLKSKSEKEKFILLKQFGFTKLPFISTTEDDHWAFEYAFSLVCYDKQTNFKPNGSSAIEPLMPRYLPDGKPRFPYLGIVYATLHSTEELEDSSSERIIDLFAENAIDTRCAAPGGHVTGGYIRAKERIFVNTIDDKHIFVGLVVRVPNLSQPYHPFLKDKYGLEKPEFEKFKATLFKAGSFVNQTSLRNEKLFFRTQLKIIEKVIAHQEAKLLEFLMSCVNNKNFQLKMYGSTTQDLIDPCNRDTKEEKAFIKSLTDLRKQASSLPSQSTFELKKRKHDELTKEGNDQEERHRKQPRK